MIYLVTGGRDFTDKDFVFNSLDKIHSERPCTFLIHGDASGVDTLCGLWAKNNNIGVKACPAEWNVYGKTAGIIRNSQMLHLNPDVLIAFPGNKGTRDMVRKAINKGIEIIQMQK